MRYLLAGVAVLGLAGCDLQPQPSSAPPSPVAVAAPEPAGTIDSSGVTETISGGGIGQDGFWFSGGNRHLDGKGPGILYGYVTPPDGEPRMLYVALFKYPEKYSSFGPASGSSGTSGDGNAVTIDDGLKIDGKEIKVHVAMTKAGCLQRPPAIARLHRDGTDVETSRRRFVRRVCGYRSQERCWDGHQWHPEATDDAGGGGFLQMNRVT
jgi:hypothetical protein